MSALSLCFAFASGTDLPYLQVNVAFETENRLRVKIFDPDTARWEIPESLLPLAPPAVNVGAFAYEFSYTERPFGFAVTRVDDGEVIFNSTAPVGPDGVTPLFNGLVFEDQFLEISSVLPPSPVFYGLGEKVTTMQLATEGNAITFWARDAATPVDQNIYGSHPFYLENRQTPVTEAEQERGVKSASGLSTKTHGAWLRNSNGMDVLLYSGTANAERLVKNGIKFAPETPVPGMITYRVIGGVLDFFVYVGSDSSAVPSTPEAIVQQYHTSVGFPHMPPFWSLGFHQCRWGYPNLQAVENMVASYAAAGIPLDTAWTDIDYMNAYEDFSTDPVNYPAPALAAFIEKLHKQGQHYMVIMDPAIHNRTGYPTFDQGLQQDVFIKQASGDVFVGKVWPGYTAFPSFYAPNTPAWWAQNIQTFRAAVPVDGLWIDMNEASNFCTGDCDHPTSKADAEMKPVRKHLTGREMALESVRRTHSKRASKSLCDGRPGSPKHTCLPNNPPYRIDNGGIGMDLNTLTIDMDSTHGQGFIEYNVHNMYGFSESIATNAALEAQMNSRSLVISRSTFSGSGKHTGHWTGDNQSTWASMASSIPGILAMQFFGITMVGSDICGFQGNSNEELCARWMALGSFYPFSRNHNTKGAASQEPYVWPSVAAVSIKTLGARYELIHVYNTLFFNAHQSGGTVVRPLFFNFPWDTNTFPIGAQFMIGTSVMITPVLTQGATSVTGYFPLANAAGNALRWYDWWSLEEITASIPATGWANLQAPLSTIPVHIAGGSILPLQEAALNTVAQASNPFRIVVALDNVWTATGSLFMDDGMTLSVGDNALQASFAHNATNFQYFVNSVYSGAEKLQFTSLTVTGLSCFPATGPTAVTIGSNSLPFTWDATNAIVSVSKMSQPLNQPFQMLFHS